MSGGELDSAEAGPGKILHPGGVARVGIELADGTHRPGRAPPVVQLDAGRERRGCGLAVAAVPVDEQDPPEALALERAGQLAQHLRVRALREAEASGEAGEVRRHAERERR